MPCILKALIAWMILLVVSGAVGLFLRQALFGIFVPFPPSREACCCDGNTIFCFVVSAAYVWAVAHFWNVTLAITAFLIMIVVVEHYAQAPSWIHFIANAILWGSSVLVWYTFCKQT